MCTFEEYLRAALQRAVLLLALAGVSLVSQLTFLWLSGCFPEPRGKISVSDNPSPHPRGKIICEHV